MPLYKPGLDSDMTTNGAEPATHRGPSCRSPAIPALVLKEEIGQLEATSRGGLHGTLSVPAGKGEEFLRSVKEEQASCHLSTLHCRAGGLLPEESRAQNDSNCSILQSICSLRCLVSLTFCNQTASTFSSHLLHSLEVHHKKEPSLEAVVCCDILFPESHNTPPLCQFSWGLLGQNLHPAHGR